MMVCRLTWTAADKLCCVRPASLRAARMRRPAAPSVSAARTGPLGGAISCRPSCSHSLVVSGGCGGARLVAATAAGLRDDGYHADRAADQDAGGRPLPGVRLGVVLVKRTHREDDDRQAAEERQKDPLGAPRPR